MQSGFLDALTVPEVAVFRTRLGAGIDAQAGDAVAEIQASGTLSDDNQKALRSAVEQLAKKESLLS